MNPSSTPICAIISDLPSGNELRGTFMRTNSDVRSTPWPENRSYKLNRRYHKGIICSAVVQTVKHIHFISSVWTQLDVDAGQVEVRIAVRHHARFYPEMQRNSNNALRVGITCFRAKLCVVTLWESELQGVHCTTPTTTAARTLKPIGMKDQLYSTGTKTCFHSSKFIFWGQFCPPRLFCGLRG